MKKRRKLTTCILILVLGFGVGCDKFLDINVDPTLKPDASLQELLPTAEFYTSEASYLQAYFACQYAQQLGSALGSVSGTETYLPESNPDGWAYLYLYILPQLNEILRKSEAENAPVYRGIAKILLAYNLGQASASWENVPFSEADKLNFTPGYDNQQAIYDSIQLFLDEGIEEVAKAGGGRPSTDDLIYSGDVGKWTRLAYSLKARYAMHLSVKDPVSAAQKALDAVSKGMRGNEDDFQLIYNSKNLGPWYKIALANNSSNLSVTYASTFVDLMNGIKQGIVDPRLTKVVALRTGTAYTGVVPGSGSGAPTAFSTTASWHSTSAAPVVMVTYSEAKALEAEARFLLHGGSLSSTGSTEEAYAAYLEIAATNMKKLGVGDMDRSTYLEAPEVAVMPSGLTLMHIMKEKFKAMFLIGDSWTDIRRYNYLDFPMPLNVNPELGGQRIQRLVYPLSETTRNSDNVAANSKEPQQLMWLMTK
jgi:hypothetical protein